MECIVNNNASLVEEEQAAKLQQVEEEKEQLYPVPPKDFTEEFKAYYQKLLNNITPIKKDANGFKTAFRMFMHNSSHPLSSPSVQYMRIHFSRGLSAVYIFKLHHQKDQYTHCIYVRLNGFLNRYIFDPIIQELVYIVTGRRPTLKAYVPLIKKDVSTYDYFQSLYVSPTNLILSYTHQSDAVPEVQRGIKTNNQAMSMLKSKMHGLTCQIVDNMIAMPSRYQHSYLFRTLQMDLQSFRKHMRATNLDEVMSEISKDAYNIALQDSKFKLQDIQELMDPMTRRAMLNRCITDKQTKHTQELFSQRHGKLIFVHPHPYNSIVKSELHKLQPLDGMLFDPRFLFSILMTARWFVRVCMVDDQVISNNHAHLLLYGGPGTGKTLLMSSISSCIPTYKYVVQSRFQNPALLQSSLISLEEFDTQALPSNQYKQLLDIKTPMKVDFKNLNPENATEGVPCMLSTNDDVFTILKTQKKYNQNSIQAALRRLYIVPMKAGAFEKLHGRIPQDHQYFHQLLQYDPRFDKEADKLERIFNLIVSFCLYQEDVRGMYLEPRMHQYFTKLIRDFKQTAFGTFYVSRKAQVDEIIQEAELAMTHEDIDDSSYLVKISTCVGQFQQLQYQFLESMMRGKMDLEIAIIKDKTVPWPIKTYYMKSSCKFNVSLMWEADSAPECLNKEVQAFLADPKIQLYAPTNNDDEYADVKEATSTHEIIQSPMPTETEPDQIDVESVLSKRTRSEVFFDDDGEPAFKRPKQREYTDDVKEWLRENLMDNTEYNIVQSKLVNQ